MLGVLASISLNAYQTINFGKEREIFTKAEELLKKGNSQYFLNNKAALETYPLYPYLLFAHYKKNIDTISSNEVQTFINQYADSPISEKLRNAWLNEKVKQRNWKDFLNLYKFSDDVALQCHYINSHYQFHHDAEILKYIPSIWLTGQSQPKSCEQVFDILKKQGMLSESLIWQRIKLSIGQRNLSLARYLGKMLGPKDRAMIELWIRTNDDPFHIKRRHYFNSKHPAIPEILMHGLLKVIRKSPHEGINLWAQIKSKHKFNDKQKNMVCSTIASSLANIKDPSAKTWLKMVPVETADQNLLNTTLKLALQSNDWHSILDLANKLPKDIEVTEKWQYWIARSLEMTGNRKSSQRILNKLSKQRSYYGFVSSLRVLKPYSFNNQQISPDKELINKVEKLRPLSRAKELLSLNRLGEANSEWRESLKYMNEHEIQAAAYVASKWKNPNWSIVALAGAENKNALTLRFPKAYSKNIFQEAKVNIVDPAWVFAIARQESAFIPTAYSGAGAMGLMQIMPSTAKMLAKKSQIKLQHNKELFDVEKNIKLGAKYLRILSDKYQNNIVLATASYNAGPTRVTSWLPEYNMPADIWIETIPFKETREYVQNVLAYTLIYQDLLGQKPYRNKYLPVVLASNNFK